MKPVIVCVDDEPMVLDSLKEQLRRTFGDQVRVEVAQDAPEALELIAELEDGEERLPVIVSDHIMPGMRGDALLIEVHKRLPRTRKILLTGQAGADAVGNVVNLGALYRYIAKPWDRDDFVLTIREALKSYEHEERVEEQRAALEAAHAAGRRFVPFGFLHLLGRERLEEVSLHDHVVKPLSAFFSDIRGFTRLVETLTPHEAFAFINEYLSYMEPAIRAEGGVIDRVAGDGVVVLFDSADRAVRAGIAQLRALVQFNTARASRGLAPIQVGMGINTGSLILGVIGGRERLIPSLIGDVVNAASRTEGYSKQVGASFLITEHTVAALEHPKSFELRVVDRVRFKGKTQSLLVYEVLDGLADDERARKLATRRDLIAGRDALLKRDLDLARRHFEAAREIDPRDPVLARHTALTATLAGDGVPADFDDVTNLEEK